MTFPTVSRQRAFTLIELLVVILTLLWRLFSACGRGRAAAEAPVG
jgi:hypothetical protein